MSKVRIVIGQLNFLVGDIHGNKDKIIAAAKQAKDEHQADLIVFPELSLTGYPPEDLLLREDFHEQVKLAMKEIQESCKVIDIILGFPELFHSHSKKNSHNHIYNAAAYISKGKIQAKYHKQCLPNYGVFDEKRYFKSGTTHCLINLNGIPTAILICEDLWYPGPAEQAKKNGAEFIIGINASPFDIYKLQEREKILKTRIKQVGIPIIYAHSIGGQDEVVFDGRSMVMDQNFAITHLGPVFEESLIPVDIELKQQISVKQGMQSQRLADAVRIYNALVLGVRDYIEKNNFPGALIGSSGGIDSALALTIATDAIGPEKVHAVLMPSRYTSDISNDDAIKLAENLGIKYSILPIEDTFNAFLDTLAEEFKNTKEGIAEQNIQARCRGLLLMALSNKFGKLVLTTGNKSEMAVGYATLYGDMAGGFAVLKDVYKTLVYRLARYRNSIERVIPERIINRPPSAELAHDQKDEDHLPPYDVLDAILHRYIEEDLGAKKIIADGFNKDTVYKVIQLVDRNEYKRRQAPPGVKITTRAFGRDRRYPITSGYKQE